jgi:hypothetical protein
MITVITTRLPPSGRGSPGTRLLHAPSRAARSSTPTRASTDPEEFALVERYESQAAFAGASADTAIPAQTSRPNSSRLSPRAAGRCSGQLCHATHDMRTLAVEIDLGELT